ncbi:MAG: heparan-alpha-glucosaminide N-acetyltransferase [Burkholderiaceae bacterium]
MPSRRFEAVDALRGVALLWMTVFHFCFDLNQFGFIHQDLNNDIFWTLQRTLILSTFLVCAGMGQAIATQQGQSWRPFWRRWAEVAGCAVLVSIGSWLMFPRSFIYFGVLHGMALMLIVVRLTARWGNWLWLLGLLAVAAQPIAAHLLQTSAWSELFNSRGMNWLGLVTRKPVTEDYVPLIPWLGVMWWGAAAGQWLLRRHSLAVWVPNRPGAGLATLGRWSLSYYMLHQPVMIGTLLLVSRVSA